MSALLIPFATLVVAAGLVVLAYERGVSRWRRILLVAALPTFWLLFWSALTDNRGRPIPTEWQVFGSPDTESRVVAHHMLPGSAIYLWLLEEGEPRAYRLPWDESEARRLYEAAGDAEAQGVPLMMRRNEDDPEQERRYYAEPQQPLPPKVVMP